jgi:hypothetical protein
MLQVPSFETVALVTDDDALAARASSLFRRRGRYFSVLDGPRMSTQDADNEAVRRHNALVMTGARQILMGGLPSAAITVMQSGWKSCTVCDDYEDLVKALRGIVRRPPNALRWGRENLGVGLYVARMQGKELCTDLASSPEQTVVEAGTHLLVACERGDAFAEVVASNLAFASGASFALFPELPEDKREDWLEELYALGDGGNVTGQFNDLAQRARAWLGPLAFARHKTVLFVTAGFPWGISVPEKATSHMYRYPDFGRAVVEGLWASQSAARSSRTALLIDPHTVNGSEIPEINLALRRNGTLIRAATGSAATSTKVQFLLDLLPFDIIVLSSHAGDVPGERITYEYPDADGRQRRLTVDRALGWGYDRVEDKVQVTEYFRFHALDGVDWRDRAAKAALPVGSAITSWIASGGAADREENIIKREPIPRVIGSMAIQLHGGPWLFASHGFAPEAAPLIVNNSCWSWHELSGRTTFAGARAYVGSLMPITDSEAQEVGQALFGRYLGCELATALWLTQRHVYGASARRPYVMVGLPFVSVRPNKADAVSFLNKSYLDSIAHWSDRARLSPHEKVRSNAKRFVSFLIEDLQAFCTNLKLDRRPRRD